MIFMAYIGGVYTEAGLEPIQEWANQVLGGVGTSSSCGDKRTSQPPELAGPPPYFSTPPRTLSHPPPKRIKSEQPSDTQPLFFAQTASTSLRRTPTPQHTMMGTMSQQVMGASFQAQPQVFPPFQGYGNPLAPAQPSMAFLPLFNQMAAQRRVTVEYPAEFSGPSHAGRRTVQCVGK